MGEEMGADAAAKEEEETPQSIYDLEPEQIIRLEAGVEEVLKAIKDGADEGSVKALVRELNAEFTPEIVGVAMELVNDKPEPTNQ